MSDRRTKKAAESKESKSPDTTAPERLVPASLSSQDTDILALQHQAGNQAVSQLLQSRGNVNLGGVSTLVNTSTASKVDSRQVADNLDFDWLSEQVHEGMAGWGTDEEGVYLALQKLRRDPEAVARLETAYQRKYGETLEAAIRDDFSGSELEYALQLINMGKKGAAQAIGMPPNTETEWQAAAKRFRDAVQGWGTDEEAIFAALMPLNRDPALTAKLKAAYFDAYKEDLRERLVDEMSGSEREHALYLLGEGPQGMDPKYSLDYVEKLLDQATAAMTAGEAREALYAFRRLRRAERYRLFKLYYPRGSITRLLKALSAEDAAGEYRAELAQVLRWLQEQETRKASGLTDQEMASLQAKYMRAEAEKEAKKDKPVTEPPTVEQIEKARQKKVRQTSIEPPKRIEWDDMPETEQKKWQERGRRVVETVVAYANKQYPELKISQDLFRADFRGVEARGQRVLAYGSEDDRGKTRAVFGYRFVEAAEANPAYVMSVVVHEVFGHPEYGEYGTEYHLALYDKAAAKMPGYTKPPAGSRQRRLELDAFAYQETEIYTLLRSLPYHTPVAPSDVGKKLVSIDPTSTVRYRIGLIKKQWEPALAAALIRGLYQRLSHDPRITPEALEAFREGVRAHFKAEAERILT